MRHATISVCENVKRILLSILIIAILEVAVFGDHYTLNDAVVALLPVKVQAAVAAVLRYFVALFLGALFLYILFEIRALEHFMSWLLGCFSSTRNTLGWANARWQISGQLGGVRQNEDRATVVQFAPAGRRDSHKPRQLLNRLVDNLDRGQQKIR